MLSPRNGGDFGARIEKGNSRHRHPRPRIQSRGVISVRYMTLKTIRTYCFGTLLLGSAGLVAQQPGKEKTPAPAPKSAAKDATPSQPTAAKKPDQAAAYYHFSLAHMYEEMMAMYGRSEYATKAIEEYRLAIDNDPSSDFLNSGLAELYYRTGRIRDAVQEAQAMIQRDPNNLQAHKLLGPIY